MDPIVKRHSSQEVLANQYQTLDNGVVASSVAHFQQDPSQRCDPNSQTDRGITHMVSGEQLQQGIVTTSRNPDCGEQATDDTLKTSQVHDEVGKGSNGSVYREFGHRSFCCNFPRDRCFHGANCLHLQSEYTTFVKPEYDWCVKFHLEIQVASENPGGNASNSEVAESDLASLCGKTHASLMDADASVLNKNSNSKMNVSVNHEGSEKIDEVKQVLETSSKLKKRKRKSKCNEKELAMHSSVTVDSTSSFLDKRTDEMKQALKSSSKKREEGYSINPEEPMKESTQVMPSGSCEETSVRHPGVVTLPVVLDVVKQAVKSSSKKRKKGHSISPEEPMKESIDPSTTQVMLSGSCEEASVRHPGVVSLPVVLDDVKQASKIFSKKRKKGHSINPEEPMKDSIDPLTQVMPSGSCEEISVKHSGVVSLPVVLDDSKNTVETNTVDNAITANHHLQKSHLPSKEGVFRSKKKLLVLDLNGLLADVAPMNKKFKADALLSGKAVYRRPFYEDFIDFCFEQFDVGVWSSRKRRNIIKLVDILMGEKKKHLLFCWDQSQCTKTGYNTLENNLKPLVLKELKKLWEQQRPNVPWDKGYYNETNTVLLDDSPYKALRNPPNTAIFPQPYTFRNVCDNSLGPKGDLRLYLTRLAEADDTQKFICENPFGQKSLMNSTRNWSFYSKIVSPQLQNPQKKNMSGTKPLRPKKKKNAASTKPPHPKRKKNAASPKPAAGRETSNTLAS